MPDQVKAELIKLHPIGKGLDAFRTLFNSLCADLPSPGGIDQLARDDVRSLALNLLLSLRVLPISPLLPSTSGENTIRTDIVRLSSTIYSRDFDLNRIKPLLKAAAADEPQDAVIWDLVQDLVATTDVESTPPRRPIAPPHLQTPWRYNTSSFANSYEYRKDIDGVLKEELGTLYVGLPGFRKAFFGRVENLEERSNIVFQMCKDGSDPLFHEGWKGWPKDANQDSVLKWFTDVTAKLAAFAETSTFPQTYQRPIAVQPNRPVEGSTGERKLDIGFMSDLPKAGGNSRYHWSQILVPGELKSNPLTDIQSKAWLDIGRYAREVLAAQDTRRFVLAFTICGSQMRIWEFDRLGGLASEQFDINQHGQQFVSTILGFLWMKEKDLGFDPTITTSGDKRYLDIERDGCIERLVIDGVIRRAPCIAGRATTCWKAYSETSPSIPLVIKDSWQEIERVEEGELLRKATERGVTHMARYYHHETVRVDSAEDDISRNVRKGLEVWKAKNYQLSRFGSTLYTGSTDTSHGGRGSAGFHNHLRSGTKRSSSDVGASLPASKRSCSVSPIKQSIDELPNRVHRRIVLCDYGKPIYKASSPAALLAAFRGCIKGHESLHKAGLLHRDISINNLMINEDDDNPSQKSFIIDLDLAIEETRDGACGASGKTGTRTFMAIGALLGEQHCYMHDLESFFWVLFWICIHYNGSDKDIGPTKFDCWNYLEDNRLMREKLGIINGKGAFRTDAENNFTPFYEPLIRTVDRLRQAIFPNSQKWEVEDPGLYSSMEKILLEGEEEMRKVTDS
ncbi:serine/threonine-protein kinase Sgk2 [Trichoderma ceciliae]